MIMPGAEPFIFNGKKDAGVLLLHGFTGSPSEMRLYGEYLNKAGYTVMGVRLTGHGTSVGDMEHATGDDWMRDALDGHSMLSGLVSRVAVVGLSMGALLAMRLSTMRPIWRTVSLAAPIIFSAQRDLHLLPPRDEARGKFLPKAPKRMTGIEPKHRVCYRSIPLVSIHELLAVIESAKASLHEVRSPLLVVQSERDHTVNPESARYIMDHVGSPDKQLLWLRQSGHRLTIDIERDIIFKKTVEFLERGL
ncbi:MAG: alpha/beta fold hydrolase [Schwartzia sp.]|nr:alpha/beta fold hydrolase [Schwartzia sp. (in: firmicutes)]